MAGEHGSWAHDFDGLCVTVVRGRTPEQAAHALALGDFAEFPDAAAADAWVRQGAGYDRSWFATGAVGGWTFVWEDNGWQGVTTQAALRLADGGPLVSMFWNVESVMTFLALDDGRVVRQFDPLFHDEQEPPTAVAGVPLAGEAGLDWAAPRLAGLALLARTAGVPDVGPSWLALPGVRFWGHRF